MPALFRWRMRRPARALRLGLFHIHDRTWRTSIPVPSAAPSWPRCVGGATPVPKGPWRRSYGPRAGRAGAGNGPCAAMTPKACRSACGPTSSSAPGGSRCSSMAVSGTAARCTARSRRATPPSGARSSGATANVIAGIREILAEPGGGSSGCGSMSCGPRCARGCSRSCAGFSPRHEKARPSGRAVRAAEANLRARGSWAKRCRCPWSVRAGGGSLLRVR